MLDCTLYLPPFILLLFPFQDIQLGGLGILHEHCQLDIEGNEVYVTPLAKTGYVLLKTEHNEVISTGSRSLQLISISHVSDIFTEPA